MSRFLILTLLGLGITACPWYNAAAAVKAGFRLTNYRADYIVKYDGIPFGQSTTTLNIKKAHYNLCINNVTTLPFLHGHVEECSEGVLKDHQVFPLHYTYLYQRDQETQQMTIQFNWKTHQAIINGSGKPWHMTIPSGTQDKISYQLLLRQGLASHQRLFKFPVADGGKIKTYEFIATHTTAITTPFRKFDAIQLKRSPMPGKEKVTLWLAPTLNNLVVKVQQQKHLIDIGTAEMIHYHA